MLVGVDLATLRKPLTGVGNYQLNLLKAVLEHPHAPDLAGFQWTWRTLDRGFLEQIAQTSHPRTTAVLTALVRTILDRPSMRKAYSYSRGRSFRNSLAKRSFSVFHAFAFVPPAPIRSHVLPVVYDLSFVRHPGLHPASRVRILGRLSSELEKSAHIHTISNFSAAEICDVYRVPRAKIKVIPPGINPVFLSPLPATDSALRKYNLRPGFFFLAVATLEPRKNLKTLISSFALLPRSQRLEFPLCIVGAPGWGDLEFPDNWRTLISENSLRFFGYVSDEGLRSLYTHCRATLYPSLYEGFGMPVIEAMACGAAVICSNAASMPEAAGTHATLLPPLEIEAWRDALMNLAYGRKGDPSEQARQHALSFRWDRSASDLVALYRAHN